MGNRMPRTIGNQKLFATYFAGYTGLSLPVVEAWLLNEQPPGSPSKPGSNNWLNIGYTDAGPNSEYSAIEGQSPQKAAKASAEWLKKNQPSILSGVGKSQKTQAEGIINSNWASSHYGYDVEKFLGVVSGSQTKNAAFGIPFTPSIPGENIPKELIEGNIPNPLKPVEEGFGALKTSAEVIEALTQPKTWVRIGEGIIGSIIIISALKTLSNKYGPSRVLIGQGSEGAVYARKGIRYQKSRDAASKKTERGKELARERQRGRYEQAGREAAARKASARKGVATRVAKKAAEAAVAE